MVEFAAEGFLLPKSVEVERFRLEIAIIFRVTASKFQHAVVGIGYALLVKELIPHSPNFVFRRLVGAHLHLPRKGDALILEFAALVKINARLVIVKVLRNFVRGSVGGKVNVVSRNFSGRKHCAYYGIPLFVYRCEKRRFLFGDKFE